MSQGELLARCVHLRQRLAELHERHAQDPESLDLARATTQLAADMATLAHQDTDRAERGIQEQIARMMNDPAGKAFTTALTDQAFRSKSPARTADQIRHLLERFGKPAYMTWVERGLLTLFERVSPLLPGLTVGAVMKRIRGEMSRVVLPAEPRALARRLLALTDQGVTVNLNHLGEAILGQDEAQARFEGYLHDLSRPEVACVSVKISTIVANLNLLAWQDTLNRLSERLRTLYRAAMAHPYVNSQGEEVPKLVYLDMEEFRDLELTVALFGRVLDEPEFLTCPGGLVLQAYLPDSHPMQRRIVRWAMDRRERGGASVRLRVVKGANLAMERFEAVHRGWTQAPYGTKAEVDANYKRMIAYGCVLEHAQAVHLGIASHNLFDLAYGLVIRAVLGSEDHVGFELLDGMADATRRVVQAVSGDVLIYAPMVEESQVESAIAYLVRRLDENTGEENYLRHAFDLLPSSRAWSDQERRFLRALRESDEVFEGTRRDQDRRLPARELDPAAPFVNEPDTDWSLSHNRAWILEIAGRWRDWGPEIIPLQIGGRFIASTSAGLSAPLDPSRPGHLFYQVALADEALIEEALATATSSAGAWAARPSAERAQILSSVAHGLRAQRGELMGAMIGDAGKILVESDVEVSEAIDFAEYYARSLKPLEALGDMELRPRGVVLIAPPWNFPLAIAAGGVLAALMAGNTVILKPAPEVVLTGWLLAKLCWEAGVPREALQFIACDDDPVGSRLVSDPRLGAILLTGATETAQLFHRLRPELTLFAETGGKNALIVSSLSDRDLAISDAIHSAFGHGGQKCSALSLLICEREVLDNPSFLERLADAARTLVVGSAWDPRTDIAPLIAPPSGALLRALTCLDEGERWVLEPKVDPQNPALWSPGIKAGVRPGSFSHQTEFFGPVLSVMEAQDLDQAMDWANAVPYGLTSGLHSLDRREQERWRARMDVGNGYINRPITGAIVQRQPFGGRKASGFGPGAKAGGPNYVAQLMVGRSVGSPQEVAPIPDALRQGWLLPLSEALGLDAREVLALEAALGSMVHHMGSTFARASDPSGIAGEENLLGYQPCRHILLRLGEGSRGDQAARVVLAAAAADVRLTISAHPEASVGAVLKALAQRVPSCRESDGELAERLVELDLDRVRSLGSLSSELRLALVSLPIPLVEGAPVDQGRLELLSVLKEQSMSITDHRYGNLLEPQ